MDESFSFPLPRSLGTRIHMRLITKANVIIVHLTTVSPEEVCDAVPMGSMVYALPDVCDPATIGNPSVYLLTTKQRFNPGAPLSAPIYKEEPTFDFATRFAKILVRKTQMHVYVSSSISLASTGLGGSFEEEMEAFRKVAEVAIDKLRHLMPSAGDSPNGTNDA